MSILDLKQVVAEKIGEKGTERIRLLFKKKPCADSKALKDLLGDEAGSLKEVELSVMVIGGAAAGGTLSLVDQDTTMAGTGSSDQPAANGQTGADVFSTEEFWSDLNAFLSKRVGNQEIAQRAMDIFRESWESKRVVT